MSALNKMNDDSDVLEREVPVGDVGAQEQAGCPERIDSAPVSKSRKRSVFKRLSYIMGGDMFSKDGFVGLLPFFFYVVFLSMLYITNVYVAEDVSRSIAKSNRKIEDLHVEYVYLKSEITKITKQSNMVKMLRNKGIKESVEPLKKIVVGEKGGCDED